MIIIIIIIIIILLSTSGLEFETVILSIYYMGVKHALLD